MIAFSCDKYDILKENNDSIINKKKIRNKKLKIKIDNSNNINDLKNNITCTIHNPKDLTISTPVFNRKYKFEDDELQVIDYPYQKEKKLNDNFFDFVAPVIPKKDDNWLLEKEIINYKFNKTLDNEKHNENILEFNEVNKINKNYNKHDISAYFDSDYKKNNSMKNSINGTITTKNYLTKNNYNYIIKNNTLVNANKIEKNKSYNCFNNIINKNKYYFNNIQLDPSNETICNEHRYNKKLPHKIEKGHRKLKYKIPINHNIINDKLHPIKNKLINHVVFRRKKKKINSDIKINDKQYKNNNSNHILQNSCSSTLINQRINYYVNNKNKNFNGRNERFIAQNKTNQLNDITNLNTLPKSGRKTYFRNFSENNAFENTRINKIKHIRVRLKPNICLSTQDSFYRNILST